MFVGSVAAGLPLLVSASSASSLEPPAGQGHRHLATDEAPDVMFDHASRRLASIVNKVRHHGPTAGDVRLVAAHCSMLAIYAQQSGIDARMRVAIRELLGSQGGREMLTRSTDRARMRTRLERYGVVVEEHVINTVRADEKTRRRAADDLLRLGLTGVFTGIASICERTADGLDRHGAHASVIRFIQDDDWRTQFCAALWAEVQRLTALAVVSCAATVGVPQIDLTCAIAEMSLLVILSAYSGLCL